MKYKILAISIVGIGLIAGGVLYFAGQNKTTDITDVEAVSTQIDKVNSFISESKKSLKPDTEWIPYKNEIYGYEFDMPKESVNPSNIYDSTSFYVSKDSVVDGTVFVTAKPLYSDLEGWLLRSYAKDKIEKIIFDKQADRRSYLIRWPGRMNIFTEANDLLYVINLRERDGSGLMDDVLARLLKSFAINKIEKLEILLGNAIDWSHKRKLESVFYTLGNSDEAKFRYEIKPESIGRVLQGKYKGAEIIEIEVISLDYHDDYEGKRGPGIGNSASLPYRAILTKDRGIITQDFADNEDAKDKFKKLFDSLKVSYAEDYSIRLLSYFSTIFTDSPKKYLVGGGYSSGGIRNDEAIRIVGKTPIGPLYMDKEDSNEVIFFYDEVYRPTKTANSFYLFLPEGSALHYVLPIDFNIEEVLVKEGKIKMHSSYDTSFGNGLYESRTRIGCHYEAADWVAVLPPEVISNGDDLQIAGRNVLGDPIYSLPANHKIHLDFYEVYKKYLTGDDYGLEYLPPLHSFKDFVAAYPILIWKDPFGRFVRFVRGDFIPPATCEPIIYLYPEKRQEVSVELGTGVNIIDSYPKYVSGWNVIGNPDGTIEIGEKKHPYLFWEGFSYMFPMRSDGFVVRKSEVRGFFLNTLARLGLNNKETNDFIDAWEPKFKDAPYYFITFYEQEFIDYFAPLKISPKPDTIIRVLIDFEPLSRPIEVSPIEIETPVRNGFTVVEWGGLIR